MKIEDYKKGFRNNKAIDDYPNIESFDDLLALDIQEGDNLIMDDYDWVCESIDDMSVTLVHNFTAEASPSSRLVYQYRLDNTD